VDLSNLIMGSKDVDVTVLGVKDGEVPGNKSSSAEVQERDSDEVVEDGIVQADLKPHEIMQVVIDQPVWTPEMELAFATSNDDPADDDPFPLPVYEGEDPPEPDEPPEEDIDTDVFEGMDMLLLLLPLLALAGFM
jgi:hypothetical protein